MDCFGPSTGECERVIASQFEETRMAVFGVASDVELGKVVGVR
jgi:hypothetical protein